MDIVKFAVVGLGSIGSRHLAVLEAQPMAKIVSICDIEPEKYRKFKTLYEFPSFTDYDKMLEQTDADVIDICTPHGLHAPMAIKAANKGKHILVEKPMALTVHEAKEMIVAAEQNAVRLMVVKQNRYNVPVVLTNQVLGAGKLGRVFMTQCNVFWNRNPEYYRDSNWRGKKTLEGGALFTQVSHFIDLLIWWFGDIKNANAQISNKYHNIEVEDCGVAQVEFASGVMGSLTWTTCVYNKNYEGSITIIGEKGTIKIGGQYLNKIEFWDVQDFPFPETIQFNDKPNAYGKYQGTSSNHDKVINEVVNDLLYGRNNSVNGDEGIKTVQAIELIYKYAVSVKGSYDAI
jgi:UDP-N-acetyl-2-amino-2-deoxyglucuronate dehydrogenase